MESLVVCTMQGVHLLHGRVDVAMERVKTTLALLKELGALRRKLDVARGGAGRKGSDKDKDNSSSSSGGGSSCKLQQQQHQR